MKPTHGILNGAPIELGSAEFRALTVEQRAEVAVDFGYGLVRPYRQLLESVEAQLSEAEAKKPPCPKCQSTNVVPIMYGMPAAAPGPSVHVGGCVIRGDGTDPKWHCKDCEHSWGRAFDEDEKP